VAVSPDGQYLLSAGYDRSVRLWEMESGREVRPFLGHALGINHVAFSPDGKYALSASADRTLRLWDVETGREVRVFEGHTGWVRAAAFSPDGRFLVSGSADYRPEKNDRDHSLRLWDVNTGQELFRFEGETQSINGAVFTPDGRFVLTAGEWRCVLLWDVEQRKLLRRFATPESTPISIAVSPDGRMVATGHNARAPQEGEFFDPDHSVVCLWDVETGQLIRKLRGHSAPVNAVAFSPDGRYVVSGSGGHHYAETYAAAKDNSLRLWDVTTGEEVWRAETGACINSVAFTPDGRHVVSGGGEIALGGGDAKPDLRRWRLPESVWPQSSSTRQARE
jgi:WD40 repeat protein